MLRNIPITPTAYLVCPSFVYTGAAAERRPIRYSPFYGVSVGATRLAGNGNFLPAEGSTVAMDILAEKCFCYRRA